MALPAWACTAVAAKAPLAASTAAAVFSLFQLMFIGRSWFWVDGLPQAVLALDLIDLQAADARQRPATVGHHHGDHDFVGARRVGHTRFHRVEVAAHERRV